MSDIGFRYLLCIEPAPHTTTTFSHRLFGNLKMTLRLVQTSYDDFEELYDRGLVNVPRVVRANPRCVLFATLNNKAFMVKLFLRHGAYTSPTDETGFTALHISAGQGNLEIVKLLLSARADINAVDHGTRSTPLHLAVTAGATEVVLALLEAGAKVDVQSNEGTPLYVAAMIGRLPAVRLLLDYNSNAQLLCASLVALDVAAKNGHADVINELGRRLGFEACGGTTKGRNSLRLAVDYKRPEILKILTLDGVEDVGGYGLCRSLCLGDEKSFKILLSASHSPSDYVNQACYNSWSALQCLLMPRSLRTTSHRLARRLLDAGMDTKGEDVVSWIMCRIRNTKRSDADSETRVLCLRRLLRLFLQEPAVHALSWGWPSKIEEKTAKSKTSVVSLTRQRATKLKCASVLSAAFARKKVDGAFVRYED